MLSSQLVNVPLDEDIDDYPAAINLARLFQTIDVDQDPSDGITIPVNLRMGSCTAINFNQSIADFSEDLAVLALLQRAGRSQLVNAVAARNRLQHTIDFVRANGRANFLPTANSGADQTVAEGATALLNGGSSSDPDGRLVKFRWTELSSLGLVFDPSVGSSTSVTAPNVVDDQTAVVNLQVTDDEGATDNDQLSLTIVAGAISNLPPAVSAGTDQAVDERNFVQLSGQASDSDGEISSLQWVPVGNEISLDDAGTLNPSFVAPDVDSNTAFIFRLSATDDQGDTASDDVAVTVRNIVENLLPTAFAGNDQTVDEGDTVTLDGRGSTDQDGSVVGFSWSNVSSIPFTIQDANTSQATFVAPQVNSETSVLVRLEVTDDQGASASDELSVLIRNVIENQTPNANAGSDQTVEGGVTVTLNGDSSSDPDGTISQYAWSQILGDPVELSSTSQANPSFQAPMVDQDTSLGFRLTVTDDNGAADSDDVSVLVKTDPTNSNRAPKARFSISPNPADAGSQVVLDGSTSTDPDGDALSYLWREAADSNCGLLFADDRAESTTTTAPDDGSTTCTVVFAVTDAGGLSDSASDTLSVQQDIGDNASFEDCVTQFGDFEACVAACNEFSGNACSLDSLAELCVFDVAGAAPEEFCPAQDSDNDGVNDNQDLCPNTDAGATVDENGCAANQEPPSNPGEGIPDPDTLLGELCSGYDTPQGLQQCLDDRQQDICDQYDPDQSTAFCDEFPPSELPVDPEEVLAGLCSGYDTAEGLQQCLDDGQQAICDQFDPAGDSPFCGDTTPGGLPVDPAELIGDLCSGYGSPDGLQQCFDDAQQSVCDQFDPLSQSPVCSDQSGDGFTARIQFGNSQTDPRSNAVVVTPDENGNIGVVVTPYMFDTATGLYASVPDGQRIDMGVFYGQADADPVAGVGQQQGTVVDGQVAFTYNISDLPASIDGNGYSFQAYYFGPNQNDATRQSSHFVPKEQVLAVPNNNAIGLADAMDDDQSPSDQFDGHPFSPVFVAAVPSNVVQGDGFTARIQFGNSQTDPSSNGTVVTPDAGGNIAVVVTPYVFDTVQDIYTPVPDGQRIDMGVFYGQADADPVAGVGQQQGTVVDGQVAFTYNISDLPASIDGNGYSFQAYYFGPNQNDATRQSSHFVPKEQVLAVPNNNAIGLADAMDDDQSPSDQFDGHPFSPVFVAAVPSNVVQGDGFTARIQFGNSQTDPSSNGTVVTPDGDGNIGVVVTPYVFDIVQDIYTPVPDGQRIDMGVFYGQADA
ncbi:MAG: PKD domain-containing protein, partial [Oceanococcus sp.]